MRIDAHQHFWNYNPTDYVWMSDEMTVLKRDHLPDELSAMLRRIGFDGTVAVQARQMTEETDYLLGLAGAYEWIYAVVGWLDFTSEQLEEELARYAVNPRLAGLRELIHDMPDDDYALSPSHMRGVELLGRHGLTYDLLLRPQHIPAATQLVDRFANQRFVVDHIAKPDIAAGALSPWRERIAALAEREHVYCKLSGMVTEADPAGWSPEDIHPYLDICLEAFGPARLMIGSDWPVCTLAGSYAEVMRVVLEYVTRLTVDEQDAILGRTCAEFYGIEAPHTKE